MDRAPNVLNPVLSIMQPSSTFLLHHLCLVNTHPFQATTVLSFNSLNLKCEAQFENPVNITKVIFSNLRKLLTELQGTLFLQARHDSSWSLAFVLRWWCVTVNTSNNLSIQSLLTDVQNSDVMVNEMWESFTLSSRHLFTVALPWYCTIRLWEAGESWYKSQPYVSQWSLLASQLLIRATLYYLYYHGYY